MHFLYLVRVNGGEGTPVPIPNTEVKLVRGDNTWLATAREDNSARTWIGRQPVGCRPFLPLSLLFCGDTREGGNLRGSLLLSCSHPPARLS